MAHRLCADEPGQLSAGTVFEVKCLFAIDPIAAVYRATLRASRMLQVQACQNSDQPSQEVTNKDHGYIWRCSG
jgi:hypothetical protein